jgi:O-antigen ligase
MIYHPHMHNTFLDLAFEYGLIPALLGYCIGIVLIFRILFSRRRPHRLWIFYCLSVVTMATFQHLFYTLMQTILLLPLLLLALTVPAGMLRAGRRPGRPSA